jgi:hypothetical protein
VEADPARPTQLDGELGGHSSTENWVGRHRLRRWSFPTGCQS